MRALWGKVEAIQSGERCGTRGYSSNQGRMIVLQRSLRVKSEIPHSALRTSRKKARDTENGTVRMNQSDALSDESTCVMLPRALASRHCCAYRLSLYAAAVSLPPPKSQAVRLSGRPKPRFSSSMPQIIAAREKLRGFEERIFDIVCRACTPEQVGCTQLSLSLSLSIISISISSIAAPLPLLLMRGW